MTENEKVKAVKEYEKLVEEAMVDLCLDFEIIGYTALNIGGVKVLKDCEVDALGYTDCKAIYINAPYAKENKLNKEHIKFLIAHEVFHILTLSLSRREDRDPYLWNIATDLAINQLLIEDEEVIKGKDIGLFIETGYYEKEFRNMSAEEIYNRIKNDPEYKNRASSFNLDSHLDLDDPKIQEDMREAILRANSIIDQFSVQGKLSDGLKRLIDSIPKVKEDWRPILSKYIKSFKKAESTWKRPNKRYLANKFYLPTRYDTPKLNVAVGIDTSGSISMEALSKFFGHLTKVMKSFKSFEIQLFCWSTEAHKETYRILNEKNYKSFNPVDQNYIKSFGGTIVQSAFDYVKDLKKKPDIFILFSDGEFENEIKDFPNISTIFAIHKEDNENFKIPTGIKRGICIKVED